MPSAILLNADWFRVLTPDLQETVKFEGYEQTFKAGEVVVHKGQQALSWIGVDDGLLKVSAVHFDGKVVMFTGVPAGGWVGEGAVIKREIRRYDVVAMRDSRVVHIPESTFRLLLARSLAFNHCIIDRLNERLSQYIGMMEIDRLHDPVARVARSIATLYNPLLNPRLGASLGLSQTELGELIGLSRQTVGAALRRLSTEQLLQIGYGGIVVKDLAALSAYGEHQPA